MYKYTILLIFFVFPSAKLELFINRYKIQWHQCIGSGYHGIVYNTCIEDNCNYVTKRLISMSDSEMKIQNMAANSGLAPRIIDHFHRGREMYVIMEKVDGVHFDKFVPASKEDAELICTKAIKSIINLNKLGIRHNDLHPGNIFVYCDRPISENGDVNECDVKLIDFGLAEYTTNTRADIELFTYLTGCKSLFI